MLLMAIDLSQHMAMRHYLSKDELNIYHYPHFDLPLLTSTPSVITIHDLTHVAYPEFFADLNKLKQFYMRLVTPRSLAKARAVIAVSEYTRQEVKRLFSSTGIDPFVVYSAVDER